MILEEVLAATFVAATVVVDLVLFLDEAHNLLRGKGECVGTHISWNHVAAILWIQDPDLIHWDFQHIRDLAERHTLVNLNCVDDERTVGILGVDAVLAVIGHHIVGSDKRWHIATSFLGQVVVDFPEVGMLGAHSLHRFVDIARTTVVGSNGKRPVAIGVIELLEEHSGLLARDVGVAAGIDLASHLHAYTLGCRGHELPQAAGTGRRHGIGVECALNNGDILELKWHVVALKGSLKDGHIVGTHTHQLRHQCASFHHISLDIAFHDLVEWHLD